MAVRSGKFVGELRRLRKVGLDSSLLIYHLEDVAPYSELTHGAFDAIADGSVSAVLSTISVTELLVRPFAHRQHDHVAALERFVLGLPNTAVVPPGFPIAREAARLRARYGIRTPDALLVATALGEAAGGFVTNDGGLRRVKAEGIAVLVLDDYV